VLRVILAGYLLTALALFGAAFVQWRHRVYFIAVLTVGVVIAVGAHPYRSPTPLGALFKSLASSSTAALAMRSTGRAVPLVILALAVFLGLTTNFVSERLRTRGRLALALAAPAIVIALLAVNFPALYNGTFYGKNLQRPEEIPSYWKQAVASLGNSTDTRVLEAPGSDFASYRWGNTVDPITPGLTDRPYVARELIPYGTAGSADLLNALDRRLQEGVADPRGIVPLLRRMGVGTLLARNDIQYERYDLVPPRELVRLLARTPGLESPASYGPAVPSVPAGVQDEISLAAPPNEPPPAPVAVYNVLDPLPIVRAESNVHALMVSGDGEGLVDVADVGLLDQAGVVRYSASYTSSSELRAATNVGAVLVITDNNRLRARSWTSVKDNVGYTEQAGEADKPLDRNNADARLPLFPNQQASAYTTTIDSGVQRAVASAYGNIITYTPEDRAPDHHGPRRPRATAHGWSQPMDHGDRAAVRRRSGLSRHARPVVAHPRWPEGQLRPAHLPAPRRHRDRDERRAPELVREGRRRGLRRDPPARRPQRTRRPDARSPADADRSPRRPRRRCRNASDRPGHAARCRPAGTAAVTTGIEHRPPVHVAR
jgi:arabinofuranan 3-O-arabinosyltransferase